MRARMIAAALPALAALNIGCGASTFLKGPIEDQCTKTGLKGCPEITEGAIDFIDGDKAKGTELLEKGCARNSPKELKDYADAILLFKDIPGLSKYMGPVLEVATIIKGAKTNTEDAIREPGQPTQEHGASASTTPKIVTGRVTPTTSGRRFTCFADKGASCVRLSLGPLMITDVSITRECGNAAVLFSIGEGIDDEGIDDTGTARWVVAGPVSSGHWLVPEGEELAAGLLSQPGSDEATRKRCAISFAAQKP
jgi:hypothetical protein